MSDASAFGFGKFVPGFDFLQNLSKTASQSQPTAGSVPGMGSWVAPTLSVEEIDKRIQELKSVLFWLEQNTTALKATIQAMEVQKMTLTTLQSMNVNMADLAKAFTVKPPTPAAKPEPQVSPATEPEPQAPEPVTAAEEQAAKPAVDPMQWWGALTQQFQSIAAAAVKDVAAEALKAGMTAQGARTRTSSQKTAQKTTSKSASKTSVQSVPKKSVAKVAPKAKPAAAARKAPAQRRAG
jgi:hypothetical protein